MVIWIYALWVSVGIFSFAGAHFVNIGWHRRDEHLYLSFGMLSLLLAIYAFLSACLQTNDLTVDLAFLERAHVASACLIYPTAFWFVALYTDLRHWRRWVISAAAVFGLLLVVNIASPSGLLLSNLARLPPLRLPWGELVGQFTGTQSPFAWVYYLATSISFLWFIQRCWVLWRNGKRARAIPLSAYLLLQLVATLDVEYNTIMGIASVDLDVLPFLGLVVLLSQSLTRELRQQSSALTTTIRNLHDESVERSRIQSNLHHLAYHDELTGLPNRRTLNERIAAMMAKPPTSNYCNALVVIDIDHFKTVNDALGHSVGDQVLIAIARRLEHHYPGAECLARLGGDEYALLLTDIATSEPMAESSAAGIIQDISHQLAGPFHLGEHELMPSISMGVALHPGPAADAEELLRHANLALHRVKSLGRGQGAVFAKAMQSEAERRLMLERGMRSASIESQLHVVYQPQLDAAGSLVGAEALLRWRHPEWGSIDPQEFITIAEQTGLIHMLGRHVLRQTCAALCKWQTLGFPPFRVAVNISPWQIALSDFVATVTEEVHKSGADARRLTLEITESAFIHNADDVAGKIRQLDAAGIRVAIDDFGTGYASIATLKTLPVRELKIDQIFVRDMQTEGRDGIIESMIGLAHAMNLHIVAEGVETPSQHAALAAMGCDAFQGYMISRPLGEQAFLLWLQPRWGWRGPDSAKNEAITAVPDPVFPYVLTPES